MTEYDMDAARAARIEAEGRTGHTLRFGGEVFDLPPEMPIDAAEALGRRDHRGFMAALVDGSADRFFAQKPSIDDIKDLVDWATGIYIPGSEPGESPASSDTSSTTSLPSRPPSSATTV
jgi:hypothetical protein